MMLMVGPRMEFEPLPLNSSPIALPNLAASSRSHVDASVTALANAVTSAPRVPGAGTPRMDAMPSGPSDPPPAIRPRRSFRLWPVMPFISAAFSSGVMAAMASKARH